MSIAVDDETIEDIVQKLPPELREELREYAAHLLQRRSRSDGARLTLSWAGELSDVKEEFTALDLEEKALDWWGV